MALLWTRREQVATCTAVPAPPMRCLFLSRWRVHKLRQTICAICIVLGAAGTLEAQTRIELSTSASWPAESERPSGSPVLTSSAALFPRRGRVGLQLEATWPRTHWRTYSYLSGVSFQSTVTDFRRQLIVSALARFEPIRDGRIRPNVIAGVSLVRHQTARARSMRRFPAAGPPPERLPQPSSWQPADTNAALTVGIDLSFHFRSALVLAPQLRLYLMDVETRNSFASLALGVGWAFGR